MALKQTGQLNLAEALLGRRTIRDSSPLDRLSGLVKWYRFEKLLVRLREDGPGRPAWPPLVLFKALLLQSLYGLSDRELEEALLDRLSFRRFVGLSLEESVPDHTVLNRFRNLLIAEELLDKLFVELDGQLEKAGVMLKRGTMAGPAPDTKLWTARENHQGDAGIKLVVGGQVEVTNTGQEPRLSEVAGRDPAPRAALVQTYSPTHQVYKSQNK